MTFIGVSLLDFSADFCDRPLRALLLDTCNTNDRNTGLNIHAFLMGMGVFTVFFVIFPKDDPPTVKKYTRTYKSFYIPSTINDIFI